MDHETLVDPEALESFVAGLFEAAGMIPDDARFCAHGLVLTSLWGKDSHGVMRVPHYVSRMRSGAVNARPVTTIIRGAGALQVLDGDNGPGLLVGRDAMKHAIDVAQRHDLAAVGAIHSSHFGAAALYARLAVDQGMIGIAMTNTAPKVVAPGGLQAVTGSNPIAIGVPSLGEFPFLLDAALSTVAGGRLLLASERGERIPLDWALDPKGEPTDDPAAAFAGSWFPMGGVKGLGLSYAVDILCGLITGGAFGLGMKSQYSNAAEPSGTGHMMIALRVEAIMDRTELAERMATLFTGIKSSPMRDPDAEMLIPGERAYRTEKRRRAEGLPLSSKLLDQLVALGSELDVPPEGLPGQAA